MTTLNKPIKYAFKSILILMGATNLYITSAIIGIDIWSKGELHKFAYKGIAAFAAHVYRDTCYTITKDKYGRSILLNKITGNFLAYNESWHIAIDPVEYSPKYLAIKKDLDKELAPMRSHDGGIGYCYSIWGRKKKILKEKYGIDWKNPHELNPWIIFD